MSGPDAATQSCSSRVAPRADSVGPARRLRTEFFPELVPDVLLDLVGVLDYGPIHDALPGRIEDVRQPEGGQGVAALALPGRGGCSGGNDGRLDPLGESVRLVPLRLTEL